MEEKAAVDSGVCVLAKKAGTIRKNAKPQVLIRGLAPYFKIQLPKSGNRFGGYCQIGVGMECGMLAEIWGT